MASEWLFLLVAMWVVAGLTNAWILHRRGRSGWRRMLVCVITGPLSTALVLRDAKPAEPDATEASADDEPAGDESDEWMRLSGDSTAWPDDDPEGQLMLYGYRGLSDH
jgi:hypothetical protein